MAEQIANSGARTTGADPDTDSDRYPLADSDKRQSLDHSDKRHSAARDHCPETRVRLMRPSLNPRDPGE